MITTSNQYRDSINYIQIFIICLKVDPYFKINNDNNKAGIMYILDNFSSISDGKCE